MPFHTKAERDKRGGLGSPLETRGGLFAVIKEQQEREVKDRPRTGFVDKAIAKQRPINPISQIARTNVQNVVQSNISPAQANRDLFISAFRDPTPITRPVFGSGLRDPTPITREKFTENIPTLTRISGENIRAPQGVDFGVIPESRASLGRRLRPRDLRNRREANRFDFRFRNITGRERSSQPRTPRRLQPVELGLEVGRQSIDRVSNFIGGLLG
jgi:hypothetical protein